MLETGSERKQSLPSASIVVLEKMDSAFVKGTASDKNGRFTLTYQPQKKKEYLLKVSFMGMQSFYRALGDSVSINAGTIVLKDDDLQIDEVVVTGKLREVVMEGDTTVINASAYKTPEGAYLEDLVKRIPGLVYNKKDHSLTYNGQAISEINVNGESFFSGDKKGLTGASDWCNLADSSIGVWTGLYDYFCDMYKGLKIGFFGDVAQKNVKVLGLSAGFLGLTASILSASNRLDNKQWQSIVADYVDCGKDMLSVIKSGYALKHIGDVKSLSEIKAGPWSALNIYSAIGEAGIQSISQGFRSHEKYYADGQWDMGDTGATGIDISMAGIYGISHSLTLGFDDLIFGAIDNATGGNGTADMSYFEKAAEGYKILANKCGEAIGNWWVGLTK